MLSWYKIYERFAMELTSYNQKRMINTTPEPQANEKQLKFVVQKHAASNLHYDFRLEMNGVLKSWAIPKGPSMNPKVKRLAIMVEDHSLNYRMFEGSIPKGNYGAGMVMVWDEGDYTLEGNEQMESKKAKDKNAVLLLQEGKIKFLLQGKKLQGEFALIKSHDHDKGEKQWLLMKLPDDYATSKDILLLDKSVVSDKTIEELTNINK